MKITVANSADINDVIALQEKYHISSVKDEDKSSGFVTTLFTKNQLTSLIVEEDGLFIVRKDGVLVAYAMAASWSFWSQWPMFAHMIRSLHTLQFLGQQLNVENSYQYGPVCLDKSVRGTGVLEMLFDFSRAKMAERYPILLTFINKINTRSLSAHTRKLNFQVIQEFEFNGNQYYELAYDASKPLICRSLCKPNRPEPVDALEPQT